MKRLLPAKNVFSGFPPQPSGLNQNKPNAMRKTHLPITISAFILSLAALTLPTVSDLNAADIFTKITVGPGSGVGNSRGAAWGDYDNDGFIDLFVANIGPGGIGSATHFLYHNNTNGTFSRITNGAVAQVVSAGRGAAWGDYDNDGFLDLTLVNVDQTNYLFHNSGDGLFAQIPSAPIVSDLANFRDVTWVDYDNDGYVDFFRTTHDPPRRLYHNDHDGTFTRITQGDLLIVAGTFYAVAWGDYNNDGRPDLFLPQASEAGRQPNYLYRNDGAGTFTRVGAGMLDGNFNSTAAAWGDYDNDGDLDLFASCAFGPPGDVSRPNLFYRNNGDGTFTSLTSLPANDPENQGGASSGCTWGDYDNDGWLDLFVANRGGQNDFLYLNNGDGTFTKILDSIAVTDGASSFAAACGDYDNDGFLDLFVGNGGETNLLYHNNGNENHWLKLRLIGTRSNRAAIGAKVRVQAIINGQSLWQMREVSGGDGLKGQNSLHVHVGLGNATNADLVRIEWPSGTTQELTNVAVQQFLTITEPGGEPRLAVSRENGQVQLTLTGKQGSRYAIETSTALPNWESANLTVTVTNQSGAISLRAPIGNGSQAFYRAVWQ
jgi:enediyne biosynthesis protein E4